MKKSTVYAFIAGLVYSGVTKGLIDLSPVLFSGFFDDPAKTIGTLSFSFLMLIPFAMGR